MLRNPTEHPNSLLISRAGGVAPSLSALLRVYGLGVCEGFGMRCDEAPGTG